MTSTIAVCVLTFRRRVTLRNLLEHIARLESPSDAEVTLVVVDNDAEGSARVDVEEMGALVPWPVTYVVEPTRGIATARNHAVDAAGDVDFIAFIDDDEVPDPRWLTELIGVQRATGAAVVTGPILPEFEREPPAWATDGAFFERKRFATGTDLGFARTGNVLISRSVLGPTPFDTRFDLAGGEDTHLFMRIHLAGGRIVWSDEAIVTDLVPAARMTTGWLLRREYRRGNTLSVCLRDLTDSWPRRLRRVGQAGFRVLQGTLILVSALVRGRATAVHGLRRVAFGLGLLTGLGNRPYEEYRTARDS